MTYAQRQKSITSDASNRLPTTQMVIDKLGNDTFYSIASAPNKQPAGLRGNLPSFKIASKRGRNKKLDPVPSDAYTAYLKFTTVNLTPLFVARWCWYKTDVDANSNNLLV